jgi:predicted phage-related endonuclease
MDTELIKRKLNTLWELQRDMVEDSFGCTAEELSETEALIKSLEATDIQLTDIQLTDKQFEMVMQALGNMEDDMHDMGTEEAAECGYVGTEEEIEALIENLKEQTK